ncbi:MAG: primosomal protein N' [Proteobacteria bacterium]|nr:primosomal protein N' [Pseudomonadota bacterium]MBU1388383.1 primosomal protein N' [Pseudomonadota bacterium]MBU1542793.1 primosomal protein N' [Pseudomonadota bacterium]MBU2481313.1 primosomal protein N' [Pseudomonadota bacterium]
MTQTSYISVAVVLPVINIYTYSVPDHLKAICTPGMRVLVPFGQRRVTGYVIGSASPGKGFKIKKILDVLDEYSLFPVSQIDFFQWISDYYLHPLGEVIKAALPSGLNQHDVLSVFVTDTGQKLHEKGELSAGENQVIEYVASHAPCSMKQLLKALPNICALVRKMEKQDLICVSAVLKKDGTKIKEEKFILPGKGPDASMRMSKKRLQILSLVKERTGISLTGLKAHVPTAANLIKPLETAGYICIEHRQVFRDPLGEPVEPDVAPELRKEQAAVVDQVLSNAHKGFMAYLLSGITGSGKTEVYLRLVQATMKKKKKAIVLVPEISLISQTERRFRARFGERVAVIHSSLTQGELLDQWRKIALDKVDIVIGARSCIFAPFENIGLIVVDEEHDSSYKQETGLRYNARDLAVVRAKFNDCPVILGSATPSVQSYQNVVAGRFAELKLTRRINRHPLPEITLVDLKEYKDARGYDRMITPVLAREIRRCLDHGNQALIFLNRRGFATSPVCMDCGESLLCRYCDITMTFHKGHNEYRCHLCGDTRSSKVACPSCRSLKIKPLGFGTERVESILKEMFPDARLARMDQDTTSAKGATVKILKNIRNRNVDIIVGTQMLAKGHDFPSITLVGVVCADLSLSLPDFRAGERTFQLLAQVAGRAGRGQTPGRVIMQTYNPDHFIIEAAKKQDFMEFFQNEVPFRKALGYPPFSRMVQLKISGTRLPGVKAYAMEIAQRLKTLLEEEKQSYPVQILGPIEAAIGKISSRFRWQILLKSPSAALLNRLISGVMADVKSTPKSGIRLAVDVDPYFLM